MCSNESFPDRQILDPTHAVLDPLFEAADKLHDDLKTTTTRVRELANIVQTASSNPVATEAACIEALALIPSALTSGEKFTSRYGHLLTAPDPIATLRQLGVIFEGDENGGGWEVANEDVVMLFLFATIMPIQMQMYDLEETGNEFAKDLERIRQHEQEGGDSREKEGDSRETEGGDSREQEGGNLREKEGGDSREKEEGDSREKEEGDSREQGKDSREQERNDSREQEGRDSRELHQH